MPPPKLNAIPITKSILYEKRFLFSNLTRRSLTEYGRVSNVGLNTGIHTKGVSKEKIVSTQ